MRCKLTGNEGKGVKSHIIPQFITKISEKNERLIEYSIGSYPKKAWSSWYDSGIVTQGGEDILSSVDDFAASELRAAKLIWSSLGVGEPVPGNQVIDDEGRGFRNVSFQGPRRMRLFFLSVLWRAAVSTAYTHKNVGVLVA